MDHHTANHEAYVDAAAATLGLPIASDQRTGVLRFFGLAAAMAALLDSFPLTPADEPANVFKPQAPEVGT